MENLSINQLQIGQTYNSIIVDIFELNTYKQILLFIEEFVYLQDPAVGFLILDDCIECSQDIIDTLLNIFADKQLSIEDRYDEVWKFLKNNDIEDIYDNIVCYRYNGTTFESKSTYNTIVTIQNIQ